MRYCVYVLKQPRHPDRPYVLDLQSNLLAELQSRLVAPLQKRASVNSKELMTELMPVFMISGQEYVLYVQEAAAYPVKGLGKQIADLTAESAAILNAIDRLLG